MFVKSDPIVQALDNGLVLRSLRDAEDVERLALFNGMIHSDEETDMTRNLILHHPASKPEYWLMVEDESAGEIVSTLCLIPWRFQVDGVELRAGEMGIVGTHPDYRGRGLQRILAKRHRELLRQGGFHLSHIQGIPYFYRQFGYEYAMPLEGGTRVELHQIRDVAAESAGYGFRQATLDDIPDLMRLYDDYAASLTIHSLRDEAIWHYLLGPATETGTAAQTWLVTKGGQCIGYFRVEKFGFGEGLNINECTCLPAETYPSVLSQMKSLALERDKPFIRFNFSVEHPLVRFVLHRGAHSMGQYAWQLYLPDIPALLMALKPAFERRLAASPFAALTQKVVINLYREAYAMQFENGHLVDVDTLGIQDEGTLWLPPQLLAPLVVGYRTHEELAAMYPDVTTRGNGLLIDILFPRLSSFLHTIY